MSESAVESSLPVWERKKIEAMDRIQRVALDLFDEHGYRNVTVERVAATAGVSPSSIYRYFGTKEMLVLYDEYDSKILDVFATAGDQVRIERAELLALARVIAPVLIESMLTPDAESRIRRRMQWVATIPDIRDGLARQNRDLETQFRLLLATRTGLDANDMNNRLLAAAIVACAQAGLDQWTEAGFVEPLPSMYTKVIGSILDFAETLLP